MDARRDALRQLDFADVNRIPNVEGRNVDADDVRKIPRQTFDGEGAQALLQQAAHVLDAVRHPLWLERHIGFDYFVLRNGVKVDVKDGASERRVLDFLDQGQLCFPGDFQFHQNVFTGSVAEERVDVALGNLERFRFVFRSVHHRGHGAGGFEFPNGRTPESCSRFRCEFNLLGHVSILSVVVDLEQRRNRFVIVDSFHAFAEKLGDAEHGGLESFHRPNGRAVRGN